MYRFLTSLLLGLFMLACREPQQLLPTMPPDTPVQSEQSEIPLGERLTAHRWVQVEERWVGFPQQEIRYPFSRWASCATDDEYVFTPTGGFYWYSGPTECSDTVPAKPYKVISQYDLYPGRSHQFRIQSEGDTLIVGAMPLKAKMTFAGDTLQLTSHLANPAITQSGMEFTYVIRTQYFLPVRP